MPRGRVKFMSNAAQELRVQISPRANFHCLCLIAIGLQGNCPLLFVILKYKCLSVLYPKRSCGFHPLLFAFPSLSFSSPSDLSPPPPFPSPLFHL